jgi:hypothetical protein
MRRTKARKMMTMMQEMSMMKKTTKVTITPMRTRMKRDLKMKAAVTSSRVASQRPPAITTSFRASKAVSPYR